MNQTVVRKKHESEDFYIEEQRKLAARIDLINCVDTSRLKFVAGVDLAYWKDDDTEYAVCCIVVIDYQTREIVEKKHVMGKITVPYIPGCLAFREIGLVMETVRLLEHHVGVSAGAISVARQARNEDRKLEACGSAAGIH